MYSQQAKRFQHNILCTAYCVKKPDEAIFVKSSAKQAVKGEHVWGSMDVVGAQSGVVQSVVYVQLRSF